MVVDAAGKPLAGHAVEVLPTLKTVSVGVLVGVDQNGNPLPVNMGQMIAEGADFRMGSVVLQSAACDAQGRFKVDQVPAQMRSAHRRGITGRSSREAILTVPRPLPR